MFLSWMVLDLADSGLLSSSCWQSAAWAYGSTSVPAADRAGVYWDWIQRVVTPLHFADRQRLHSFGLACWLGTPLWGRWRYLLFFLIAVFRWV